MPCTFGTVSSRGITFFGCKGSAAICTLYSLVYYQLFEIRFISCCRALIVCPCSPRKQVMWCQPFPPFHYICPKPVPNMLMSVTSCGVAYFSMLILSKTRMNEAETRSLPMHFLPCSNEFCDSYSFQPHHTSKQKLWGVISQVVRLDSQIRWAGRYTRTSGQSGIDTTPTYNSRSLEGEANTNWLDLCPT